MGSAAAGNGGGGGGIKYFTKTDHFTTPKARCYEAGQVFPVAIWCLTYLGNLQLIENYIPLRGADYSPGVSPAVLAATLSGTNRSALDTMTPGITTPASANNPSAWVELGFGSA